MSIPISATEELVAAARVVLKVRRDPSDNPAVWVSALSDLAIALGTWDHDKEMPEAAKADKVEVRVPVPVHMSDADVLDRAADILEDRLADTKGPLRKSNAKALIRFLPELARKIRREKRDGRD